MSRKLARFLVVGVLLVGASCGGEAAAPGDADNGGATPIENNGEPAEGGGDTGGGGTDDDLDY